MTVVRKVQNQENSYTKRIRFTLASTFHRDAEPFGRRSVGEARTQGFEDQAAGGVEAGDTIEVPIQSGKAVALKPGLGFAIREGGLTVGAGTVLTATD